MEDEKKIYDLFATIIDRIDIVVVAKALQQKIVDRVGSDDEIDQSVGIVLETIPTFEALQSIVHSKNFDRKAIFEIIYHYDLENPEH